MRIDELMTRPVVTCHPRDSLDMAARLMWDHDCGSVPVVDDGGHLIGMITDRDICMAAYTQGGPLTSLVVEHAMAKQVFSLHADAELAEAEKLMADKQIRRIPVVDETGAPIGILSANDLARDAARHGARLKDGHALRFAQTMASVCRPRKRALEAA